MKVQIGPFSVDSELDADIIAAFDTQRNKSEYFRRRMKEGDKETMQAIAADVREIKRMLQAGVVMQEQDSATANVQLINLCDRALSGLGAE